MQEGKQNVNTGVLRDWPDPVGCHSHTFSDIWKSVRSIYKLQDMFFFPSLQDFKS